MAVSTGMRELPVCLQGPHTWSLKWLQSGSVVLDHENEKAGSSKSDSYETSLNIDRTGATLSAGQGDRCLVISSRLF
jgi:hypothetical protein